jgi:WD40 repeat protein
VAFTPDGRRLASASADKTIRIWDTETGEELLTLRGHRDLVGRVLFDPRGWRLASSSEDGEIRIWDGTPLGESVHPHVQTLRTEAGIVYSVTFSHDSRWLAAGGGQPEQPGEVKIWDIAGGQELPPLRGHTDRVYSVAFGPENLLATCSSDGTVRFWDAGTGRQRQAPLAGFRGGSIHSLSMSPDGRRLATCDTYHTAQLWDLTTGQHEPLTGHQGFVYSAIFSPNGKLVATVGVDHTVRLWDAGTAKEVWFRVHTTWLLAVVFSPDGKFLASADADGKVIIWNVADGSLQRTFRGDGENVLSVAFSPDGRRVAVATKEVKLWDWTKPSEKARTLGGLAGTINALAFSPDGQYLAAAGGYKGRGEIKVWDRTLWDMQADK